VPVIDGVAQGKSSSTESSVDEGWESEESSLSSSSGGWSYDEGWESKESKDLHWHCGDFDF
jgi:hypothetical protein